MERGRRSVSPAPPTLPITDVAPPQEELALPGMRSTALPVNALRARRRRLETLALLALDLVMIGTGFALAWWVRYEWLTHLGSEVFYYQPLTRFWRTGLLLTLLTLTLLWLKGAYRLPRNAAWLGQLGMLASSATTAVGLTIIATFLSRMLSAPSRLIFIYAAILIFVMLALGRLLLLSWRRWRWRHGQDLERVLVVGGTGLSREVMQALAESAATGYQLVGYVADADPQHNNGHHDLPAAHLGTLEQLPYAVARHRIEHVIVALPFWQHHALPQVVEKCIQLGIDFQVVPDFYELSFDRVTIQELRGTPLISLRENQIKGANYLLKRTMDLVLVVGTLPLWGLLALIIAALIRIFDGKPVLYRQTRIGRNGRPFEFLKFRTMVPNADQLREQLMTQNEADGPMFKIKDDPRVTAIGRVLRRTSLDEIPNLWNVLRGEMSLVGPRPAIPEEVARYEPWQRRRLQVMPGVTGLWQATGRSDTTFDEYVRLDIYYIEHWSLWLDIRILLATIPSVLSGRGAY